MGHVNFTINYLKDEVKSLESLWSYLQSQHVKATNEMLDRGYMFNDGWKKVEKKKKKGAK